MRVHIKTKGRVRDNDIKALYLILEAMKLSSPHMKAANLQFVADSNGLAVINKPSRLKAG